jgi:hypothetical protein
MRSIRNALTRRQWAKRLNDLWDQLRETTVQGFVQLGRKKLIEAWLALKDSGGEPFAAWAERELKFGRQHAYKFMKIARWAKMMGLSRTALQVLPPDYSTVYRITQLDEETFLTPVESGVINSRASRGDIAKAVRWEKVSADQRRVLQLVPVKGKFRTLVFDPAWEYDWLSLAGRAKPGYAMAEPRATPCS